MGTRRPPPSTHGFSRGESTVSQEGSLGVDLHHADDAHTPAGRFGQHRLDERQTVHIGHVQRHQHRIEVKNKIRGDVEGLPAAVPPKPRLDWLPGTLQGRNSWPGKRNVGYCRPAPPRGHGVHHYHFKLYALDAELDVEPSLEKKDLLVAMAGHVTAEAELIGTYER